MRSKSPSRRSPARKSRSRSRSRGRSKSPSRTKAKSSPSPSRKSPSRKSTRGTTPKTPTTPTRSSARIAALEVQDKEKKEEVQPQKKESPKKKPSSPKKSENNLLSQIKYILCGPVFMLGATLMLPLFAIAVNVACGKTKCTIKELPQISTDVKKYYNPEVIAVFLAYVALQIVLAILPYGRIVDGPPIKGSRRLKYRCNAMISTMVSLAAFAVMYYLKLPVSYLYTHFLHFLATSIMFAFVLSLFLYIKGRNAPTSNRSLSGNTGNFFIDFFVGREINPQVGNLDLKFFVIMRICVMGWLWVNLSMLAYDYQKNGEVNLPAFLVAGFQGLYILAFLVLEGHILNSKEIHDPMGYALNVMVFAAPFIYSFPVRFLIQHHLTWNVYYLIGISLLNVVGFLMMFGSLAQKDHFRRNPHDPALAHLERIPTPNGKGLLVGGWWGMCRRPNYLGDLIQAVCWTLPCGFDYALPYFYPVLLLILLVDRQIRDEADCRVKHGAAWDRYCERIKSRIVPHVY